MVWDIILVGEMRSVKYEIRHLIGNVIFTVNTKDSASFKYF